MWSLLPLLPDSGHARGSPASGQEGTPAAQVQFVEMVAFSPSAVAAPRSLGTCLTPFSHTSGPFLDLIGSQLNLHSGPPRPAAGCTPRPRRRARDVGGGTRMARCRVSRDLAGPQGAGGTRRGSRGAGGGRAGTPAPGPAAGPSRWRRALGMWPVVRGPAASGRAVRLGLAGPPAGRPALGTGKGARPRGFQFSRGRWLLFNIPTHVSVCSVHRSDCGSQAAVLSPSSKPNILPAYGLKSV